MLFTSASVVSLFFYATQMVKKFMLFSASFSQILDVVSFLRNFPCSCPSRTCHRTASYYLFTKSKRQKTQWANLRGSTFRSDMTWSTKNKDKTHLERQKDKYNDKHKYNYNDKEAIIQGKVLYFERWVKQRNACYRIAFMCIWNWKICIFPYHSIFLAHNQLKVIF